MEKIIINDKDKETLYKKLSEISPLNELYYMETVEEGKIFKSIKYKVIAIKKDDIKQYIKEFLSTIGSLMEIEIHPEIHVEEGIINVNIITNNSPILIGKEGKNIEALQILLRQSLKNQTGMLIKVNLDASEYKLKKQRRLKQEIHKIAREVRQSKVEAKLDPMNGYDRRIVHSIISQYDELETVSVGEAPNRYVIIKYKQN